MSASFRSSKWFLVVAVLLLVLGAPGDALAKKKGKKGKKGKNDLPDVELVGLDSLDDVFKQLRKLDKKVSSAEKEVNKSQRNLNTALGIKNDTPVKKGLAQLQKRAEGKVSIATNGNVPKLEATDAVPKNVADAIDAVNTMATSFTTALSDLGDAVKESEQLGKKVSKMPASVKDEFMKDSGGFFNLLFKLPKTVKAVNGNLKVALSLPGRTTAVVGKMTNIVGSITSTFSPL